mmetsp:Transcript_53752/g.172293  ORF Transcript_53752/g.172293 Transcript_53752/m.172293 type:complete len:349 (-) Transcript_53752:226-1272(-)
MAPAARQPGGLSVTVLSASGLRAADLGGKSDPYCVCQVPGRPQTRFKTHVIKESLDPVWNCQASIADYSPGDPLEFVVWDQDFGKSDDLLGRATLSSAQFYPAGFEGDVPLFEAGDGVQPRLRVRVAAMAAGPADSPFFTAYWASGALGPGGMRNDFTGDVGFAFVPRAGVLVTALGRHVNPGLAQLREPVLVTLWDAEAQAALASAYVGPGSVAERGYAYAATAAAVRLEQGREYRLSQRCCGGMADYWFDGVVAPADLASGSAECAEFRGSVYGDGHGYPARRDDDERFPTQYRRVGMLNFKVAAPAGAPPRGQSAAPPGAALAGGARAERPERLAIRFVCMSPSP